MNRDPIVDEIRASDDRWAKRYDYDIDAIVKALRKASVDEGRKLVSLPQRPWAMEDEGRRGRRSLATGPSGAPSPR